MSTSNDIQGVEKTNQDNLSSLHFAIFNQVKDSVVVTDKQGCIVYVNQAFCLLTQYSENEVMGENPSLLKSGVTSADYYQKMWCELKNTGFWSGEIWNRKKDGTLFCEAQTIAAKYDDEGLLSHYISTFSDKSAELENKRQLDYVAYYDQLTKLPNQNRLIKQLETMQKARASFNMMIIKINEMDDICNTYGPLFGEQVLVVLAERLSVMGEYKAFIARMAEHEFALIAPVQIAQEKIISALYFILNKPMTINGQEVIVSIRIGVMTVLDDWTDTKQILANTRLALQQTSNVHENGHFVFIESIKQAMEKSYSIAQAIKRGLLDNQFELFYQPQIDINNGLCCGAEALIRWRKNGHYVLPSQFLPEAKKYGLLAKIDRYVFERVLQDIQALRAEQVVIPRIAINMAGALLPLDNILFLLEKYKVLVDEIEIEVTEVLVTEDDHQLLDYLSALENVHIKSSIDDFGTGYSSLSRLRVLPCSQLKIDKQFVDNIENDVVARQVCESIVVIAKAFGKAVLAEGVENAQQLELLKNMNCDICQGFFHSKPLPFDAFIDYLIAE